MRHVGYLVILAIPVWGVVAEISRGEWSAAGVCAAAGVGCAWALWWPKP